MEWFDPKELFFRMCYATEIGTVCVSGITQRETSGCRRVSFMRKITETEVATPW